MSAAADQIIYLEKFIESSTSMPAELNRILNTIRELDEKSEELAAQIQDNFEAVMQKPAGKAAAEDVATLRARIQADQCLLVQWAEEKVQLALQGHELLDYYDTSLSADVQALQQELEDAGHLVNDAYDDGGFDLPPGPAVVEVAAGRRSARSQFAAYDSMELPPAFEPRTGAGRKTTVTLNLPRAPSGYSSEGFGAGGDVLGWDTQAQSKRGMAGRPRSGPMGGHDGLGPRRRAASAAVHATAAAMAAMDEDDGFGDPAQLAGDLTTLPRPPPLAPGLVESSRELQAPGRLLTLQDISPALVGSVGELYWPEDKLWYLVRVESVDMASMTARLYYQTGELESLSLEEVANEGHLSLITNEG